MSINDNPPTSNPGGKTMLLALACFLGAVVLVFLYYKVVGF